MKPRRVRIKAGEFVFTAELVRKVGAAQLDEYADRLERALRANEATNPLYRDAPG